MNKKPYKHIWTEEALGYLQSNWGKLDPMSIKHGIDKLTLDRKLAEGKSVAFVVTLGGVLFQAAKLGFIKEEEIPIYKNRLIARPLSKKEREIIIKRDGNACQLCGENEKKLLEVDHIIPRSQGGTSLPENLQTLCKVCHKTKGLNSWDLRGINEYKFLFYLHGSGKFVGTKAEIRETLFGLYKRLGCPHMNQFSPIMLKMIRAFQVPRRALVVSERANGRVVYEVGPEDPPIA